MDREESADCEMESYAEKGGHFTHISKVIGNAGGTISCKGSSFKLVVPKGALPSETNKELYLRLYMERPYDWEKLKKKGHIVELPVIEIGPPGTEFLKPVELHITNRIGKELKDIEFEYSEHEYSEFSKWQKAKREKTRREAWTKAESEEHHVSYVVEKEETIAYCMHFVCGRKIKKSRSKLIEATVYMSRHSHLENYAALTVYFYEPKEEIYQVYIPYAIYKNHFLFS